MNTSEQPRRSIQDFFADHEDDWRRVPSQVHFLGSYSRDADYGLYLLEWVEDDGDGPFATSVLAIRHHSEGWEYHTAACEQIGADSYHVFQEALRRASEAELIGKSCHWEEAGRESLLRAELPETLHGVRVRDNAVYLGGTWVSYSEVFELYLVERSADVPAVALAVETESCAVALWYEDGSLPPLTANKDVALREMIRRAREQGFEFRVNARSLAELADTTAVPTTREKGPEATMTTPKPPVPRFTNVTIAESSDEVIHLPKGMTHAQAREWLTNDERTNEQEIQWSASFDAYHLDGALALRRVFERRFGSAIKAGATEQGIFGMRFEVPPRMIEVQVGVNQVQHVPWGHFTIPIMPEHKIEAGVEYREKQLFFKLSGRVRRKFKPVLDEIAAQVREELKVGSIYKGKAFRLKFPTAEETTSDVYDPNDFAPKFINVADPQEQLILSDSVQEQVETNLFTVVKHTAKCRQLGIPLKRGVLLEGKYGTGKTLTASVLSRLCIENGWTFIYLESVDDLDRAMRFATRYAPAVIFAEDIDQTMRQKGGSARDKAMNDILNTIDGVDMKQSELMVVLTTNFLSNINKAMLRPGRLDAVITVEPPDERAVIRLMRQYAKGLLDNQSDEALLPAASQLAGQIPAIVREVVERSKLASVARSGGVDEQIALLGEDLRIAAVGMLAHIRLLEDPPPDTRSDIEKAADTVGGVLLRISGVNSAVQTLSNGSKPTLPKVVVGEAAR